MVFICALCGFFVGSLFINLFSTTFETVITCYLIQRNLKDQHGVNFYDRTEGEEMKGDKDYKDLTEL